MGEDVKGYIDDKFKSFANEIKKDLKWAVVITASVLITLLGWIGNSSVKNRMYIKDVEHDIVLLKATTASLEYKIMWMSEVSELVKEYYKNGTTDQNTINFLKQAQRMEDRIINNGSPMPTFRSGYHKEYEGRSTNIND